MKKYLRIFNIKMCSAAIILAIILISVHSCKNLNTTEQLVSVKPVAVVHADQVGTPIHPYTYGMFTELLFNMFEKGIWSEMLSDRKFFYPVNSSDSLIPKNTKPFFQRWRPVGPDEVIIMDKGNPFVGEQSVKVNLDPSTAHGIKQNGVGVAANRDYTGYLFLSGDPGVRVTVNLVWGTNPQDKQSVTLQSLTKNFKKYPLKFTAGGTTEKGRFEITGTGKGTFSIGAASLMPADNIKGYRADIINLLKQLDSKIYRWPGGNFVAGYDWRDGVGDRDKRPTRYDYAWNTTETNDVGTDEYLVLCDLLKLDPYIVVNIGFGEARSAAQWVEYANGSKDSPMGKLRAANGHPEPYNVKIWGIGNEVYGQWQLGHMSIDQYVIKHRMFADAMRKVDPSIKIVASGATVFEINSTNRHHRLKPVEKVPYQYGSLEDWSGKLLEEDSNYFDYLAEHVYPEVGAAYDTNLQKFVPVKDSLAERVRRVPNRIKGAAEAMHEYVKRMPKLKEKNITFFIDEWTGAFSGGVESTLDAAEGMHEMFRNTDVITMGGYTAFSSNIAWNANFAVFSPIGLFFKLYRQHFGTLPLTITGNTPQKEVKGTVLVDKPTVSSGNDTYPLDVMAALTADRKKLTLSIINPTFADQEIDISFNGVALKEGCESYQIHAPSLRAGNRPGQQPEITVVSSRLQTVPRTFKVSPLSITLFVMDID
ncbi:MAG: hypothetical protein ABSF81_04960 [Bacteroidales bacterium]